MSKRGAIVITGNGKIILDGAIGLSQGCVVYADNSEIAFSDRCKFNHSFTFSCVDSSVRLGEHVIAGYNVTIRNDDGHIIMESGKEKKKSLPVEIGNNVWLCAHSTILKGVHIGDNCVVAYGALVTKAKGDSNVLIAGVPGKIMKENIARKP